MIMKQSTYLMHSAEIVLSFECVLFSTVLMLPGTLFQLMGPWYANARCPYDLVLAVALL